jgi:hypothetical protein
MLKLFHLDMRIFRLLGQILGSRILFQQGSSILQGMGVVDFSLLRELFHHYKYILQGTHHYRRL